MKPVPINCDAYCACPACLGPGHAEWVAKGSPTNCTDGKVHLMSLPGYPVLEENNMSLNDEQLKADIEAVTKAGRLLTISGNTIDLDKVQYLDWSRTKKAFWVVMEGTRWDSDGDYYHNAPWITGEDCDVFLRAWEAYTSTGGVQGPAIITTVGESIKPPFKIT